MQQARSQLRQHVCRAERAENGYLYALSATCLFHVSYRHGSNDKAMFNPASYALLHLEIRNSSYGENRHGFCERENMLGHLKHQC